MQFVFSQDSLCFKRDYQPRMVQTDSGNIYDPHWDDYLNTFIGCKAPLFNSTTITGKKLSLSELKGKVVVLNLWFLACNPCVRELP
ncbi:MAG: Redoxin domain protein, partial [Bacteroidota bacterium]|nr:Redoxin domain protein [Bacteroidota bacterium]